ncbi:MAG TPA: hypothetical protein VEH31_19205 [Streptosporangiaceae bacterium]|nr:hypothetical protein [Streptosporangiaceae bacterium]
MAELVQRGWLGTASVAAYQDGIDRLLWAWPPDGVPAPRLVQTHFLDPVHSGDVTVMGIRWQATGVSGPPFPALDADITLTAEGSQHTRVTLTGVYRSPLGTLSGGLDRALLHQAATATADSLLTHMSRTLQATTSSPGAPKARETGPETAP